MKTCPCHSNIDYDDCCRPLLEGEALAQTPLALMRSRYCAYATNRVDYIEQTMRGKALQGFNREDALNWSSKCQWQNLEILSTTANTVHFIATFIFNDKTESINENSLFERRGKQWFYVGMAKEEKPSRNDLCPCGSGNKYKRCCL